jgi:hypothetical protein
MTLTPRILILCALCALAVAAPVAAMTLTIDSLPRESPVDAGQGALVWSRYDDSAKAYRLVVRRGGVNSVPAIDPSPIPFDADLGSDAKGKPDVVYSRCATYKDDRGPADKCDLYVLSLTTGTEHRIAGASTGASESGPTLSRGKLAWVAERKNVKPAVYRRTLTAPKAHKSTRVAGLPKGVKDGSIFELELSGNRLAEIVGYANNGDADATEVRLVSLRSNHARRIAFQHIGENNQEYTGLSFSLHRIAWFKDCLENAGCAGSGAYRMSLSTHRYDRALDPQLYAGWQWTGDATYTSQIGGHAVDCRPEGSATVTPCLVLRNADPAWKHIAAKHVL